MDYTPIYIVYDHNPVTHSYYRLKGHIGPTLQRRNLLPIINTGSGRNSLITINVCYTNIWNVTPTLDQWDSAEDFVAAHSFPWLECIEI